MNLLFYCYFSYIYLELKIYSVEALFDIEVLYLLNYNSRKKNYNYKIKVDIV